MPDPATGRKDTTMPPISIGTRTIVLLSVILLAGGLLRGCHALDYMRFTGDEARDLIQAKNIITRGDFPVLGPKIFRGQGHLGPAYAYGMALPLSLADYDPAVSVILVICFDLLAVFLVFLLGRLLFDESTGLIAAGLYALSFTMIFYSRWGWHPSFIPFFTLLSFISMLLLLRQHYRWLPVLAVSLGIVVQFHISAVLLFFPASATLWRIRHCLSRRLILISVGLFLCMLAPLLAYEGFSGFQNLRNMLKLQPVLLGASTNPFPPFLADIAQVVADQAYWPYGERRILLASLSWIYPINVLLVTAAIVNGLRELPKEKESLALILAWVILFPLTLISLGDQRSHYYMLAWFPLTILLVGRFLAVLLGLRPLRLAGLLLTAGLIVVNILTFTRYVTVLTREPYDTFLAGPLTMKKEAVRSVTADAGGAPFAVRIISWHWCNHWPYLYLFSNREHRPSQTAMTTVDLSDRTTKEYKIDTSRYFVASPAQQRPTWYAIVEPATLYDVPEFETKWDAGQIVVYKLSRRSDEHRLISNHLSLPGP